MTTLGDFHASTGIDLSGIASLETLDANEVGALGVAFIDARDRQQRLVAEALDQAARVVPRPFRRQAINLLFGSGRR